MRYRQCQMLSHSYIVNAWIPEPYARIGVHVSFDGADRGWFIVKVLDCSKPEQLFQPKERRRQAEVNCAEDNLCNEKITAVVAS